MIYSMGIRRRDGGFGGYRRRFRNHIKELDGDGGFERVFV